MTAQDCLKPYEFTMFPAVSDYVAARIEGYALEHTALSDDERDDVIIECIRAIHEDSLSVAGPSRKLAWEKGWDENLKNFDATKAGRELAKPAYYGKFPYVRWKGNFYYATSHDYEHNMLAVIQDYVFDKYFRRPSAVYEFGCGTGHNLFRVRDVNAAAHLVGLDWAASAAKFVNLQAEAGAYGKTCVGPMAEAKTFDFFHPSWSDHLAADSGVYTVAALEQVGPRFHAWLNYILEERPKIVAHIEPITEVLNPNYLTDYLSIEYFKKRGYLSGYLEYLRLLEARNKIIIHEVTRTTIGSMYIEGYTVVVWSPK